MKVKAKESVRINGILYTAGDELPEESKSKLKFKPKSKESVEESKTEKPNSNKEKKE